jgi:class I fructose-bisphosphate aldolase
LDFSKRAPLTSQAKSPLILKLNAHDLLHEEKDPLGALTASVSDALRLGCVAIGYTIYPGTAERRLQYEQLRELASEARAAGLVVVGGVIRAAAALAKTAKLPLT